MKETLLLVVDDDDDSTTTMIGARSTTHAEQSKAEQHKKRLGRTVCSTRPLSIHHHHHVIYYYTLLATALFAWLLATVVVRHREMNSFDPFSILGIDADADARTIQQAFRTLSLQSHPECNSGDRVAERKFMMVAKAYEALVDEIGKENYKKYGHPDGKQSPKQVLIGLPSFLMEGNYRNLVLVTCLILMVGIIPYCVWVYYSSEDHTFKCGEKGVLYDTYARYHQALHQVVQQLQEALAGSAEFLQRNMPHDPNMNSLIIKSALPQQLACRPWTMTKMIM